MAFCRNGTGWGDGPKLHRVQRRFYKVKEGHYLAYLDGSGWLVVYKDTTSRAIRLPYDRQLELRHEAPGSWYAALLAAGFRGPRSQTLLGSKMGFIARVLDPGRYVFFDDRGTGMTYITSDVPGAVATIGGHRMTWSVSGWWNLGKL